VSYKVLRSLYFLLGLCYSIFPYRDVLRVAFHTIACTLCFLTFSVFTFSHTHSDTTYYFLTHFVICLVLLGIKVLFGLMEYNGMKRNRVKYNNVLFLDLKNNNETERNGIRWNEFNLIPPLIINFVPLFLKISKQ
jgi:peptidoglycan/LPS O-acetylase OafA/YrhL